MNPNELTSSVIGAAIAVHRELGPGLLESVYEACLAIELACAGLRVDRQIQVPIMYKGKTVTENGFRIDLLIEDLLVVELKSVETISKVHKKQLITYLRLAKKPIGLLMNFNEAVLKDGIIRLVNELER